MNEFGDTVSIGAGDRIRTGDIYLGKVVLYQLSYSRRRAGFRKGGGCRHSCREK